MTDGYMSLSDIGKRLNLSAKTLHPYIERGELKVVTAYPKTFVARTEDAEEFIGRFTTIGMVDGGTRQVYVPKEKNRPGD